MERLSVAKSVMTQNVLATEYRNLQLDCNYGLNGYKVCIYEKTQYYIIAVDHE